MYAAPYRFAWQPRRAGRYRLEVQARDAAGNVGRSLGGRLGDARAAPRRGEPGALGAQASASATRSSAAAAGAAPSRMTRGSAPVKSSTVDGVPGSSPASTAAPT